MPPRRQKSPSEFQDSGADKLRRAASKSVGSNPHDQSPFVKTPTISEKSFSPGEEKVISAVFAGFLNQQAFVVQRESESHQLDASKQLIAEHIKFIQTEGLISTR